MHAAPTPCVIKGTSRHDPTDLNHLVAVQEEPRRSRRLEVSQRRAAVARRTHADGQPRRRAGTPLAEPRMAMHCCSRGCFSGCRVPPQSSQAWRRRGLPRSGAVVHLGAQPPVVHPRGSPGGSGPPQQATALQPLHMCLLCARVDTRGLGLGLRRRRRASHAELCICAGALADEPHVHECSAASLHASRGLTCRHGPPQVEVAKGGCGHRRHLCVPCALGWTLATVRDVEIGVFPDGPDTPAPCGGTCRCLHSGSIWRCR